MTLLGKNAPSSYRRPLAYTRTTTTTNNTINEKNINHTTTITTTTTSTTTSTTTNNNDNKSNNILESLQMMHALLLNISMIHINDDVLSDCIQNEQCSII